MRNKNAAWFKRLLSGLLAVVMCVSLLPISVFADDIGGGGGGGGPAAPPTIKLTNVNQLGGKKFVMQNDFDSNKNGAFLHDMQFAINGDTLSGFCIDHGKPISNNGIWNLSGEWTDSKKDFQGLVLTWYYYNYTECARIKQENGNKDVMGAEHDALAVGTSKFQPSYGYGTETFWYLSAEGLKLNNAFAQACVWEYEAAKKSGRQGELDALLGNVTSSKYAEQTPAVQEALTKVAKTYKAAYEIRYPDEQKKDLDYYKDTCASIFYVANQGCGDWTFYMYEPAGSHSGDQRIIIPVPNPDITTDKYDVWLKLAQKIDPKTGDPVSGATFSVYSDASRKQWLTDFVTEADGSAYVYLNQVAPVGQKMNLYIAETDAPGDYALMSGVIKVEVEQGHETKDKAISITAGDAALPEGTTIQDDDCEITKIDAKTGAGVGIAVFHFEGTNEKGEYKSFDLKTDEYGQLPIQWARPSEALYVEPGEYVREFS